MKGAACCSLSYTVNLRVTAEKSKHDCVREPRVLCNGISSRHLGTAHCQTHTHHTHTHTHTHTHRPPPALWFLASSFLNCLAGMQSAVCVCFGCVSNPVEQTVL